MVLQRGRCGRLGRRRTYINPPTFGRGVYLFSEPPEAWPARSGSVACRRPGLGGFDVGWEDGSMSSDNSTPSEGHKRSRDGRPQRNEGGGSGPDRQGGSWSGQGRAGGAPRRDDRSRPRDGGDRAQWGNRDDDRRGSRPGGDRQQWGNRDDRRGPRQDDRRGAGAGGDRPQWGNRDDDRRGSRPSGDRQQWGNRDDRPAAADGDRGMGRSTVAGRVRDGDRQQWGNRDDNRRRTPTQDDRGGLVVRGGSSAVGQP